MRALARPQVLGKQEKFDMSDEVISIEEVIAYSLETFPGLVEDWNWGERSLFYNPYHQLPKGTYFLTFKEREGANDSASRIRPGNYRLNVGISKVAFTNRFVHCLRDRQLVGWSGLVMISVSGIGSCHIRSTGGCVGLQS
jgi:hypothetical protein